MIYNVYSLMPPEGFTGNKIEWASGFCTGNNIIYLSGIEICVKVAEPGICTEPNARFIGREEIN